MPGLDGFCEPSDVGVVEAAIRGFDRHFAAIRHRVACIDDKIDIGVFQLIGIRLHHPDPARQDGLQSDCFADRPTQKFANASYKSVRIEGFGCQRLLPGKRQRRMARLLQVLAEAQRDAVSAGLSVWLFSLSRRETEGAGATAGDKYEPVEALRTWATNVRELIDRASRANSWSS